MGLRNSADKAIITINNVNEALGQLGFFSTGLVGGLAQYAPGSDAYNLNQTLQTIKANIGFNELQAMRAASPTGGALGNVANQELDALQATLGSLKIGQKKPQLKKNLEDVKKHYINWLKTVGYEITPEGDVIQIID